MLDAIAHTMTLYTLALLAAGFLLPVGIILLAWHHARTPRRPEANHAHDSRHDNQVY
jgi:hypothetical protein